MIRTLLIIVISFLVSILLVMMITRCSFEDAVRKVRSMYVRFAKALFSSEPKSVPEYPVYVGSDGVRVLPTLVDRDFAKIREHFNVCYTDDFKNFSNSIAYRFNIQQKPDYMEESVLETLIQKQAEEVLANHMREFDFYHPAEPLTFAVFSKGYLWIGFAKTPEGIAQFDTQKQRLRKRRLSQKQEDRSEQPFVEKWDNDGN